MTPEQFAQQIKSPEHRPCYVVCGGEPAAVARTLQAARQAVAEGFEDFNYQSLELEAGQAAKLLAEASTMPFFLPPRVIVVKNPPFNADDYQSLADYLDDPNPEAVIVLLLEKIDSRQRFFKKIKAAGAEVEAAPPKGAALSQWLVERFRELGCAISLPTAELIIQRAGSDLGVLMGEAEKLCLYLGRRAQVTPQLVRELVSLAPNANIFELGEALGRRDIKNALALLMELLATEHPLPVLAMMLRHFRLLLIIKTRQDSSGRRNLGAEDAKDLGLHPYVLTKTQRQSELWSWPQLIAALRAFEEAQLSLVTTSLEPHLVLEKLALSLAGPG